MRRATLEPSPTEPPVRSFADGENFRVAPHWRSRRLRHALLTVYDFARYVDELGDAVDGDALTKLDEVTADLTAIGTGSASRSSICAALAPVVRRHHLDIDDFRQLVEVNRREHM